jgi:RecA-family ATPase
MQPTKLFKRLYATAERMQPKVIAIDTLSDVFIGDEINRAQVRQFNSLMRRLAIKGDTAVITASHPSLTGMNTGSGLSGTTQWHNSVRSRCYFINPDAENDPLIDNGHRTLRFLKNQYGKLNKPMELQWFGGGVWVPSDVSAVEDRDKAIDDLFLLLLRRANKDNRDVSPNKSSTWAPSLFAEQPEAKLAKIGSKVFNEAMERLLAAGKIQIEKWGPPSKPRYRLIVV